MYKIQLIACWEIFVPPAKTHVALLLLHNTISLSRPEQACLMRLRFGRYFSHHRTYDGRSISRNVALLIYLFITWWTYFIIVWLVSLYISSYIKKFVDGGSCPEVFCRKGVLQFSKNSQENIYTGVSFLIKLRAEGLVLKN